MLAVAGLCAVVVCRDGFNAELAIVKPTMTCTLALTAPGGDLPSWQLKPTHSTVPDMFCERVVTVKTWYSPITAPVSVQPVRMR